MEMSKQQSSAIDFATRFHTGRGKQKTLCSSKSLSSCKRTLYFKGFNAADTDIDEGVMINKEYDRPSEKQPYRKGGRFVKRSIKNNSRHISRLSS